MYTNNTDLRIQESVSANDINTWLKAKINGRNSKMLNKGETFIEAAKQAKINVIYLVSHCALETGWGTSKICKEKNNFFGISAYDSSPFDSAKKFNSVDDGIIKGAKWVADNYIYGKYNQNTLNKMRNNNGKHEYCTSTTWINSIVNIMNGALKYVEVSKGMGNVSKKSYYLYSGTFKTEASAKKVQANLLKLMKVVHVRKEKDGTFRIITGTFDSLERAKKMITTIKQKYDLVFNYKEA